MEATITSKGQITLPKALRDDFDLHEGAKLIFVKKDDGSVAIHVRRNNIRAIVGILQPLVKRHVSIEEMNEAVEAAAAENYLRSIE